MALASGSAGELRRGTAGLQKDLDVAMTKALGSTDRVAGQLPPPDHSVDGHLGNLKHPRQLAHGVELGLARTNGFSLHPTYPCLNFILGPRATTGALFPK